MSRTAVLVAGLAYAAIAIFQTWPLATDPGGLLAGSRLFGDLAGGTAQFWYLIAHHVSPFAPATLHGLNAPEGLQQSWTQNWASLPSTGLLYALSLLFGAMAAGAVFLWLSFVLSGLSMFLLTRRLFASPRAAFLAGFVFAFSPFAIRQIGIHDVYSSGWVLVLGVWRMLELLQRRSRCNAVLGGAAMAFAMWWTPYFILFAGLAFATLAMILIARAPRRRRGRSLRLAALAGLPIAGLLAGFAALVELGGDSPTGIQAHSIHEPLVYGARVREWLLPDRHNLIFGGLTRPIFETHMHGSNSGETSIYVGGSVLALAIVGAILGWRRAHGGAHHAPDEARIRAVACGWLLAIVGAIFSLPPLIHVFGVTVVTPTLTVFLMSSTWRVYSRLVELIELGLCLPLAYALAWLLDRHHRAARVAAFAALGTVLVLDLWARLPVRAVPVALPPAYTWLKDHPGGIVADYPLQPAVYPDYRPLLRAVQDGHPSFQGYWPGSPTEALKLRLSDVGAARTAARLAALDVRYIVVHGGGAGASQEQLARRGYRLRFASAQASVYEVGAAPAPARPTPGRGR
ncbi:MAG: hypothetical protein JOZ07_18015 [Solirubrobacterales bacterium]|nr:hypothetical protein [Solirubrobacterales bacterium]